MVNKRILWIVAYIFIMISAIGMVYSEEALMPLTYYIGINVSNDAISLESIDLKHTYLSQTDFNPYYVVKLFDIYDKVIYTGNFSFASETSISALGCIDENGVYDEVLCNGPSFIQLDSAIQDIAVPYSPVGDRIEIYSSDGKLRLAINVLEYAEYCGDEKCTESYWSCPSDCPPTPEEATAMKAYEDEYTQQSNNNTNPNTNTNNPNIKNKDSTGKYYIIGAIALILIFGLLIYTSKHKDIPQPR